MESIKSLMDKEHCRIAGFLEHADTNGEAFNKFKWNLEKHFFVEEKAIFIMNRDMNGEEVADIFELMKQHGEIMEMIKVVEKKIENGEEANFSELKDMINKHRNFEDSTFYPKLDGILNLQQKQEIMERVMEIVK